MNLFSKITKLFWGELNQEELKKFSLLALGFFLIIGSYWPLKALKEGIFINLVGPTYLPNVKIISLLTFLPLILIYSKIVDYFSKEKLLYLFISFYCCLGILFVYLLNHPTIGLSNTITNPKRLLGWAFYIFTETYISLMVAMYWSFIHDVTTTQSAKNGYGMVMFGAQFGGLLFTYLGRYLSKETSLYASRAPLIAFISVVMFFLLAIVIYALKHCTTKKVMKSYPNNKTKLLVKKRDYTGFFEGLKILVTKPYVGGIFGLTFFHEVVTTFMTIHMYIVLKAKYITPGIINKFVFDFTFYIQVIASLIALFGTSFFQRRFGIKICLMAYPIFFAILLGWYFAFPSLNVIFCALIVARAVNYAFNQPAKESLYIPTSREIKYKSKAWIDIFGARLSKAVGASLNKSFYAVLKFPVLIPFSFLFLWVILSNKIGSFYCKITAKKELVK